MKSRPDINIIKIKGIINIINTDFIPKIVSIESGATESANIYVAGDCATGPASVIKAIAMGRKAAEAMDSSLGGDGVVMEAITAEHMHFVDVADELPNEFLEKNGPGKLIDCIKSSEPVPIKGIWTVEGFKDKIFELSGVDLILS